MCSPQGENSMARNPVTIPKILLSQLPHLYLIHNKTIYSAADCPLDILKACCSKTRDEELRRILKQKELTILERWFVYNYSSIKLYTREEAERAVSNLSA
jgi:hypothetical protein